VTRWTRRAAVAGLTALVLVASGQVPVLAAKKTLSCERRYGSRPGGAKTVKGICAPDRTNTRTPDRGAIEAPAPRLVLVDAITELQFRDAVQELNWCAETILNVIKGGTGPGCLTPDPARPARPAKPGTSLAARARAAALELIAEPGKVGILPGRSLTGLPTYFWLDGVDERQADRTVSGLRMRLRATPASSHWDFGDGVTRDGGAGDGRDPLASEIRHTYTHSDQFQVRVQVAWQVTFSVNGNEAVAPGEFTTFTTTTLPVDQLRARLTG